MGGGGGTSSSSTSQQATTSTTTDQQVAADNAGVAIGAGASYVNDFSPAVADAFTNAIDGVFNFAGNTVAALNTNTSQALQSVSAAAQSNSAIASNAVNAAQLGASSILTNPALLIAGVVVIGLVVYFATKRR
jgi:hypothetical protein